MRSIEKHRTIKKQFSQPQMLSSSPKSSVTSYLPYEKRCVLSKYSSKKEKISVGAERQQRYRTMKRWRADPTEENFWDVVVAYAGVKFKTYSGLSFSYEVRKGRNGEYTKELWIDRREKSEKFGVQFSAVSIEEY